MIFPDRKKVERVREEFPAGTRVELVQMDDSQAPPIGTHGTVEVVDDVGTIHVAWDNGSFLGIVLGEDVVRRLDAVKITCYGETETWDDRREAVKFYLRAMTASEGSEQNRYSQILAGLMAGLSECRDEE